MSIRGIQVIGDVVALAVVAGLAWLTMRVVAASPGFSDTGDSILMEVALVCTVALLASVGTVHRVARPANPLGWLLVLLAILLLATEWDIPGATVAWWLSGAVFSVGVLLPMALPAAVAWAVLAFPTGHVEARAQRWLLAAGALVFVGALGLIPALFFDPQAQGCSDCPPNLLLLHDDLNLAVSASRLGLLAALAWATVMMIVLLVGLVRMSAASLRARGAVRAIGLLYLVAVSSQLVLGLGRSFVGVPTTSQGRWWAQLAGLAALATAVGFSLLRARAMRRSVTGLVVDLHRETAADGMREALSSWLHDPSLQVAYRVDGTYRDVDLETVDVTARPGRATSRLLDHGEEIAVLVHRPGLLDNPDAIREVVTAARLGLEYERLRAEGLAQVRALAQSRLRIVEAGDRERRRLERDLHDGAQQRLVGLLLGLRMLRSTLRESQTETEGMLDEAEAEVQGAVQDLRNLAAGLFPHVVVTEGLVGALQALSETAPLRVVDAPAERLPPAVETTAYLVIAAAAAQGPTTAHAAYDGGWLRVAADVASANVDFAGLEDRVAAVGGHIGVVRVDGGSCVALDVPAVDVALPHGTSVRGAG